MTISAAAIIDIRQRLLTAYNGLPAGQKPAMATALEAVGVFAVVRDLIQTLEVGPVQPVIRAQKQASFDHDGASRSRGVQ